MLSPERLLAGIVGVVLVFMGGLFAASSWKDGQAAKKTLADTQEARLLERKQSERQQEILNEKDAQLRRVNARLGDALERLRDRPDRLPEPARAACEGATGAELSGRDAAAFERLAARAEAIRIELHSCQDREHGEVTPLP